MTLLKRVVNVPGQQLGDGHLNKSLLITASRDLVWCLEVRESPPAPKGLTFHCMVVSPGITT